MYDETENIISILNHKKAVYVSGDQARILKLINSNDEKSDKKAADLLKKFYPLDRSEAVFYNSALMTLLARKKCRKINDDNLVSFPALKKSA